MIGGEIVAPALVDAFVEALVCAQIILRSLGINPAMWVAQLNELYQENYLKYRTEFRKELLPTFRSLRESGIPFYIVTNSDPAKVQERLKLIGDEAEWISPLVRGFAMKFVVTPGPTWVRDHLLIPGLARPVLLRKQHYYDVLVAIMKIHGISWNQLVVTGDIAELDLVLPVELGASGNLVIGPNTPDYERQWAQQHPRVRVIHNLIDAIA